MQAAVIKHILEGLRSKPGNSIVLDKWHGWLAVCKCFDSIANHIVWVYSAELEYCEAHLVDSKHVQLDRVHGGDEVLDSLSHNEHGIGTLRRPAHMV